MRRTQSGLQRVPGLWRARSGWCAGAPKPTRMHRSTASCECHSWQLPDFAANVHFRKKNEKLKRGFLVPTWITHDDKLLRHQTKSPDASVPDVHSLGAAEAVRPRPTNEGGNIAHAAAPLPPRSASRLRHSKCGQTHRHLVVHNSVQGLLTATLTLKVCLQISYDLACCTRRRATFGLSSLLVHWTLRTDIQPLPSLRPRRQANLAYQTGEPRERKEGRKEAMRRGKAKLLTYCFVCFGCTRRNIATSQLCGES